MPELPEVETMARTIAPLIADRKITSFDATWPRQITPGVAQVHAATIGRRITRVARRGKWVALHLDDQSCVLIHPRMSGRLSVVPVHAPLPRHRRACFTLAGDLRLDFDDARKFGRVLHTDDYDAFSRTLGVEPLERAFTLARFAALLRERRRAIKPLLLDQSLIVGLGNIYVDESLFAARIHPLTIASTLAEAQVSALRKAIQATLRKAIRNHGTSIDWIYPDGWMQNHLRVYGRTDESCRVCQTPIERLIIGQRSSHVCPICQLAPS